MGFYMGLFNLLVVLFQLVVSLGVGQLIGNVENKSIIFVVCGVMFGIFVLAWFMVKEEQIGDVVVVVLVGYQKIGNLYFFIVGFLFYLLLVQFGIFCKLFMYILNCCFNFGFGVVSLLYVYFSQIVCFFGIGFVFGIVDVVDELFYIIWVVKDFNNNDVRLLFGNRCRLFCICVFCFFGRVFCFIF